MYLETHEAWASNGTKVLSHRSDQVRDTTIPPLDIQNPLLFGNCHLTNAFQWVPSPPTTCCLGLKVQKDHQLSCLSWTHLPLPKKSAFKRIALLLFSLSLVSDCDPTDCRTTGFPVLHCLQEFAQTRVHWVGDAIQLTHPLLFPSPPAFNLSQHQGLF